MSIGSTAIGRFHDTWAAAGTDHETARTVAQVVRPLGEHPGQRPRIVVIAAHRTALAQPGGSEKDYRVADLLAPEMSHRFQVLCKNADGTRIGAVQKIFIQVRDRPPAAIHAAVTFFHSVRVAPLSS